ncbi:hypothetical protein PL81_06955 [Streptomyces sp. RSD-27]|nr:hypothetical protein PL81_06955 [Streptomyces sp. RSD-27]
MNSALPRRAPGSELPRRHTTERIPWNAFAVPSDTAESYGQPSLDLLDRAQSGWERVINTSSAVPDE